MKIPRTVRIYELGMNTMVTMGLWLSVPPAIAAPTIPNIQIQQTTVNPIDRTRDSVIPTSINPSNSKIVTVVGTIRASAEGCIRLATDDSLSYELRGSSLPRIGTRVELTGLAPMNMVTTCQDGQLLYVQTVKVIGYDRDRSR
jgi:hypothetical protein